MDIGKLIKNECRIETSCCVTQRQTLTTLSDVSHLKHIRFKYHELA